MPDRRGRQDDEDQATLDGAHPEDIHPQQAKAVGERVDQYRPEQRPPDGDHATPRERRADKGGEDSFQQ